MSNILKSQKGLGPIIIILIIVGILALAGGIYWWQKSEITAGPTPAEPTLAESHKDYKQVLSKSFAYSSGEQAAMDVPGELALSYYFNKDNKDNIYIFTQTTENIRIFDSEGNLRFTFRPIMPGEPTTEAPLGVEREITTNDLVVDEEGNIYIISSLRTWPMFLYRFSPAGEFQEKISLDDLGNELHKKKASFDKMYIADNKIYAGCIVERYISSYLIGIITNGVLEKVEPLLKFRGVFGSTSGNWYEVKLIERHKKGTISILDSSGTVLRTINLEREGLASIEFLGEDQDGNIYVQIERSTASAEIGLEVHKFDPEGNRLTIISIPTAGYILWSNKLLLLGKDGSIWQVTPADDGWHINKWSTIY